MQISRQCVEAIQRGDAAAFEDCYAGIAPDLYRIALGYTRSPHVAEEVVQEVFLAFIKRLGQGEVISSPTPFLHQATRFAARARNREEARHVRNSALRRELAADGKDPDRLLEGEESARLWAAVDALPQELCEVVFMHVGGGMSFDAMQESLQVASSTLRSRYQAALVQLRKYLKEAE